MACRQVNMNASWAASFAAALDRELCHCVRQRVLPLCWTESFATVLDRKFAMAMDRECCHCVRRRVVVRRVL